MFTLVARPPQRHFDFDTVNPQFEASRKRGDRSLTSPEADPRVVRNASYAIRGVSPMPIEVYKKSDKFEGDSWASREICIRTDRKSIRRHHVYAQLKMMDGRLGEGVSLLLTSIQDWPEDITEGSILFLVDGAQIRVHPTANAQGRAYPLAESRSKLHLKVPGTMMAGWTKLADFHLSRDQFFQVCAAKSLDVRMEFPFGQFDVPNPDLVQSLFRQFAHGAVDRSLYPDSIDDEIEVRKCIPGDALVATPYGPRQVASLVPGQPILSWCERTQTSTWDVLTSIFAMGTVHVLEIRCGPDTYIKLTPSHTLRTSAGWALASTLKVGDFLVAEVGLLQISSIEKSVSAEPVFSLRNRKHQTCLTASGVPLHHYSSYRHLRSHVRHILGPNLPPIHEAMAYARHITAEFASQTARLLNLGSSSSIALPPSTTQK